MSSIEHNLTLCGLDESDIELYLFLAKKGEQDVGSIENASQFSRATVYNSLQRLEKRDLVEKRREGRSVLYSITHPQHLALLAEYKKQEMELLTHDMKKHIEHLTSTYNLTLGKPGIRFFEGEEGIKEALYDTLQARSDIYAYVNMDMVDLYVKRLNEQYMDERQRRGIIKKIILPETTAAKKFAQKIDDHLTQIKLVSKAECPFDVSLQIYNDTISYLTVYKKTFLAFTITHPGIAQMQKSLFSFTWRHLLSQNP
ncbi:MAG TPA: helix-turn-helix domain-containing protein [Patescibacteria group bacterium]|nr:helix-turn-helix domain-containing protein [Patescibacteria group bacterium]